MPAAEDHGPETTADGHHIVVRGRRWRATDPVVPEELAAPLRSALGKARSSIRTAEDPEAIAIWRSRVQLAKEGLGERGKAWWEMSEPDRLQRARDRLDSLREGGEDRDG